MSFNLLVFADILKSAFQYLTWPILIGAIILIFRAQLINVIDNLKLVKTSSLEIRFGKQLKRQGFTEDELQALRSLSAEELDMFLLVSFSSEVGFKYVLPPTPDLQIFRNKMLNLETAGLIKITNDNGTGIDLFHYVTSLGNRVRVMLIDATILLIHEA